MEPENKTKVDEFLGDLGNPQNEDPFSKDELLETTEKKEEVQTEEDADKKVEKIPFNKDPKVQRYIEKEIEKKLSQFKPEPTVKEENTDEIDDVLIRIIGNDTPEKISAIKDFKKVILEREDRGAEKALRQFQAEKDEELKAEKEAEEQLTSGLEAIEEENGIDLTSSTPQARKLRGQFIDFVKKVAPKDGDGEISELPDLEETFKIFQSTRTTQSQSQKAKEIASRSMERGDSGDTTTKNNERKDWNFVDKIFSKLTD